MRNLIDIINEASTKSSVNKIASDVDVIVENTIIEAMSNSKLYHASLKPVIETAILRNVIAKSFVEFDLFQCINLLSSLLVNTPIIKKYMKQMDEDYLDILEEYEVTDWYIFGLLLGIDVTSIEVDDMYEEVYPVIKTMFKVKLNEQFKKAFDKSFSIRYNEGSGRFSIISSAFGKNALRQMMKDDIGEYIMQGKIEAFRAKYKVSVEDFINMTFDDGFEVLKSPEEVESFRRWILTKVK